MILLQSMSSNTVTLTLGENSTLTGSNLNFLFRLINDDSNDEKIFIASDLTAETRYNLFTWNLTGSTNEELTAGTFNVDIGWGKYLVYEQVSNTNLNLSGVTRMIENGKYYVSGITSTSNVISYSDTASNKIFYKVD